MDVTDWSNEQIERMINSLYNGEISPAKLPVDVYEEISKRIYSGVVDGFGGDVFDFVDGSDERDLLEHYKHNVAIFSGAKTHQQVVDMTAEIYKDGIKQPFSEFKVRAGEIFDTYNKNWLLTEFNMANNQAQHGRRWVDIKRNSDIFPALKYVTVGDERVRHDHAILDGIVRPVDDTFWQTYYPANDWGCRCGVEQVTESEMDDGLTPDHVIEQKRNEYKPDTLFVGNCGTDKTIFTGGHPYFSVQKRYELLKTTNFNLPTPAKPPKVRKVKKVEPAVVPVSVDPVVAKIQKSMIDMIGMKPDFVNERIWKHVNPILEFRDGKSISLANKRRGANFYHLPSMNQIHMNTKCDRWKTVRWRPVVATHEIGHNVHMNLREITNDFMSSRATKFISDLKSSFNNSFQTEKSKLFFEFSYSSESGLYQFRDWAKSIGIDEPKLIDEMFGTLTDIVGGLTLGDYGGGHDISYYRKNGGRNGAKEVFANLFQITQQVDDIHRKSLEKWWPDALEIADQYFDEILK